MNTLFRMQKVVKVSGLGIPLLFTSCTLTVDVQTTVFKDVNVITMVNDSILNGHSVFVKDGKIVDIRIFEEMTIPKNTNIVKGNEQYFIPRL